MAGRNLLTYLGDLGYTGTLNERTVQMLVDEITVAGGTASLLDPLNELWMNLGALSFSTLTNLALQSGDLSVAPWVAVQSTVTLGPVLAPDGSLASRITESTSTSTHGVTQTGKVIAGNTKYCRSVYAKSDGTRRFLYMETDSFGQWKNTGNVRYDLDLGVIDIAGANLDSYGIIPVGHGWYRCYLSSTSVDAPVPVPFDIQLATSAGPSYTGDGTSGIYAWGAQFELGTVPSSYIPTTATEGTSPIEREIMSIQIAWAVSKGVALGSYNDMFNNL